MAHRALGGQGAWHSDLMVRHVPPWRLRARFAASLSAMYGREVPAYTTLVEVSHAVNGDVLGRWGERAERLGSRDRVTAERHGAIRVGSARELEQVGRVFAAMGMHPVGFYDLRDTPVSPVPVVSTAFRPIDPDELALNPFRVFTSVLATDDERFFERDLQGRLTRFLDRRELFPPELLALADQAVEAGDDGLPEPEAEQLLELATAAFSLSAQPVDRAWYAELEQVSPVAADIGGIGSTHINHLTPRVLDIDELYRRMQARGITMIDEIQGPPAWDGPDVLLRQTSFRALSEQRLMREPNGTVVPGALRVRFGEVEARGVALTPAGREVYERLGAEVDRRVATDGCTTSRQDVARLLWPTGFPSTEAGLAAAGLGHFTWSVAEGRRSGDATGTDRPDLGALLADGWLRAEPIVYEDFLPRSAAGIFASNLDLEGSGDSSREGTHRDLDWLAAVMGRPVHDPDDLYRAQGAPTLRAALAALGGVGDPVDAARRLGAAPQPTTHRPTSAPESP